LSDLTPLTTDPAVAAERVRAALAAAGFPAARVGRTQDQRGAMLVIAGYVVVEGTGTSGPRVQWHQRLDAEALERKFEQMLTALRAAGLDAEWVEQAWELEVINLRGPDDQG
jgi:hypothetical protein